MIIDAHSVPWLEIAAMVFSIVANDQNCFLNLTFFNIYSMTCQLLVVFPAIFDQFSRQFFKEDNSVGFKIFKILISGCWCFKSAQKIAPATVVQRFTQ